MKEFPPFRLDVANQSLWRNAQRVALTPKAFAVLRYLVEHCGRLVTRDELMEAVWPDTYVQPEVVKTHILDIRHALGDDARSPVFIETQPRLGYRFVATVREATVDEQPDTADRSAPPASIAVLPFSNLSGEPENEYFGDGLAEEIINVLAKLPRLKVIARTSAFAFKGLNQDVRRIAETLGVAQVLEGSIRKSGNRLRIAAQLIQASDGSHLWSGRFDRELTDILAIQDEVSEAICAALETELGIRGSRTAEIRPADPRAFQAYLEGRYYMHQVTPAGIERALNCFQQAVAWDPNYALPHAGMALRAYYRVLYLAERPRDVVPAALTSLARALQLDPGSSEALTVRAMFSAFYEYDWGAAGGYFARALELDPFSARVLTGRSMWFLGPTGHRQEALSAATEAAALDPLSPPVRNVQLWALHNLRKSETPECARHVLQLFPAHPIVSFVASLAFLESGCRDDAIATLEQGLAMVPDHPYLLGILAVARARQGRTADARRIRAEMENRAAARHVPFLPLAYACEACGDWEAAYRLLNRAIDEREPLAPILLADRRAELHPDPRYRALLAKMNLQ